MFSRIIFRMIMNQSKEGLNLIDHKIKFIWINILIVYNDKIEIFISTIPNEKYFQYDL